MFSQDICTKAPGWGDDSECKLVPPQAAVSPEKQPPFPRPPVRHR